MKLGMTSIQKLAQVLKILVTITFACNLIVLLLVPGMVLLYPGGLSRQPDVNYPGVLVLFGAWLAVWDTGYTAILTVFLWICGFCTAVMLWQARRVLDTVLSGKPFSPHNASNMKRAGICCLIISAAALVRLIWGFFHYKSIAPLLTYNALFVPVFIMGFLLCMVMSALFRQAAELKEENDLTI